MTSYGRLIEERRMAAKLSRQELADRLGQSEGTVRRLEEEEGGPPSLKQVNGLVASLPLTAEELLEAMGYHMNAPRALKVIPRRLIDLLMEMTPQQHQTLIDLVTSLQHSMPRAQR